MQKSNIKMLDFFLKVRLKVNKNSLWEFIL